MVNLNQIFKSYQQCKGYYSNYFSSIESIVWSSHAFYLSELTDSLHHHEFDGDDCYPSLYVHYD